MTKRYNTIKVGEGTTLLFAFLDAAGGAVVDVNTPTITIVDPHSGERLANNEAVTRNTAGELEHDFTAPKLSFRRRGEPRKFIVEFRAVDAGTGQILKSDNIELLIEETFTI